MADIFDSPKRMLRWSKQHIDKLEREIISFSHEKPWSIVSERGADGTTDVFKVVFNRQLSDDLPHIVFDAANNMRTVLDQTAFAVAVQYTGNKSPKSAKFPFGPTETDMLNNERGGCKDLPQEVRSLFKSFKPYKGGNNALWALNELANTSKHKMLYPIGLGGGVTTFRPNGLMVLPGVPLEIQPPQWNREKHELIFARIGADAQFRGDFDVTFTVAFDEVDEVIRGQNPVVVLGVMVREVQEVLDLTEVMCRAVGLVK